jgi:hypothetical protein|tara:strand:- start:293 stop:520 length:228 start_codon:yes stop_codon:yes gene_type:complete
MVKKKVLKKKMHKGCESKKCGNNSTSGGIYGLGMVGALVYYVATATSFGNGFVGVLKALVWPAFVIYELMKFLGM